MKKLIAAVCMTVLCAAGGTANATLSVTGGSYTYSQNFDSLTQSTSSTAWTNDSTLAGWSLYRQPAPGTAVTNYYGGDGSSNTGAFYSFGSAGSSDRALGGLGSGGAYFGSPLSGAVAGWIAVAFTNNTGQALNGFTVGFDGEQWRNGGNTSAQTMVLQYGFGNSFAGVSNWTALGGNFDWTSPVTGSTAAAANGNVAGLVANRGGSVTANWNNGNTLWIRWIENNDVGNDHGLAIDNFSLTTSDVTPTPIPAAAYLFGSGLIGLVGIRRKKSK